MSLIAIEGMRFFARHGYYPQEQKIGCHFVVDVYVEANIVVAAETDELKETVDYQTVHQLSQEVMDEPFKLIEHVAHNIIEKISSTLTDVDMIKVRVSKLNPPACGSAERAYIELQKSFT